MAPHPGPSQRGAEITVAVLTGLFGAVVVLGSLQAGVGWGAEGPRSGFFPFLVGLVILAAAAVNLIHALGREATRRFASWDELGKVLSVVVPTAIYVALVPVLGLYLASFLLIAGFMIRIGGYGWTFSGGIAAVIMVLTYLTFERWFLVPLPKGPLEDLLGL